MGNTAERWVAKQGAGSLSALFSASLTQLQSVGFAEHLWFHPASQGFQQSLCWNNMSSVWTTLQASCLLMNILYLESSCTLGEKLGMVHDFMSNIKLWEKMAASHCILRQFSSVAQSCQTLCDPMNRSTPGIPVHHQIPEFPKLMSIELVMSSNHLILCHPLLLPPSIFPSIRVFSKESALLIRWPKDWSFSLNTSPSNEHPGLISFRMDLLDLLVVQGTLKSLLQHHSSKASILWRSAFFIDQLSHPYMTTGKTIALARQTFVDKVMSLLLICCLGWS